MPTSPMIGHRVSPLVFSPASRQGFALYPSFRFHWILPSREVQPAYVYSSTQIRANCRKPNAHREVSSSNASTLLPVVLTRTLAFHVVAKLKLCSNRRSI